MFHIVHRDLKPENIMFSLQKKRLVLIDFGTTKIIKEKIGEYSICNEIVGTPIYMSE